MYVCVSVCNLCIWYKLQVYTLFLFHPSTPATTMYSFHTVHYALVLVCLCCLSPSHTHASGFLPSVRTNHSAWVRSINEEEAFLVSNNTNVLVFTYTGVAVVDICNLNLGCDSRLSPQARCIAVTPECNCLQWVGKLNTTESSANAIELNAYDTQCVRVWCLGECTLRVDWYLASMNTTIPSGLYATAQDSWNERETDQPFGVFAYFNYYQFVCDITGFSAACPSTTILKITPVKTSANSRNTTNDTTAISITAMTVIMAMTLIAVFYTSRRGASAGVKRKG